jgi:polyhydroxybutyrate depolymerase
LSNRTIALFLLASCSVPPTLIESTDPTTTGCNDAASDGTSFVQPADAAVDTPVDAPPHGTLALVLALHGYGALGTTAYSKFSLQNIDATRGGPAAILDPTGDYHAWDASAADCCISDKGGTVAQLVAMVTARIAQGDIDPARVYAWGTSNGGFMAFRLACTHPELFKAVIVQAGGANTASDATCAGGKVAILHVHGTADTSIVYQGTTSILSTARVQEPYPAGIDSVNQEGALAGCGGALQSVGSGPYVESRYPITDMQWASGCTNGYAEHWRIEGGIHDAMFNGAFPTTGLAWCDAHSTGRNP